MQRELTEQFLKKLNAKLERKRWNTNIQMYRAIILLWEELWKEENVQGGDTFIAPGEAVVEDNQTGEGVLDEPMAEPNAPAVGEGWWEHQGTNAVQIRDILRTYANGGTTAPTHAEAVPQFVYTPIRRG